MSDADKDPHVLLGRLIDNATELCHVATSALKYGHEQRLKAALAERTAPEAGRTCAICGEQFTPKPKPQQEGK